MAETTDPEAPHGRDSEGVPLAPYGHRADGRPKLSNRGRTAKAPPKKGTTNTRSGARKRTKDETKEQLVELAGMVTSGMSALSSAPPVRKRIGDRHSDALAGDAVILDAFVPHFADVTLMFAQTRPGLLAWMDQVEEKAPILALVKVGGMCAKAIIGNHLAPDPELAVVGRSLGQVKAARFAAAIRAEAAELGVDIGEPEQIHTEGPAAAAA